MTQTTMRAARFHQYGSSDELEVEEVPQPEPGEGQVLVRVHAAGVNPVDWKFRAGHLKEFMPLTLPHIPGFELAGTVEEVGRGVSGFSPGQAVFGRGNSAYAEYALANASELAPKPERLTFDQAAAITIGGLTAWRGLFEVGGLESGQSLLVQGAAGGVGSFAVQFGRWKGARVVGTASGANADFVRSLGAETVIDYTTTDVESAVRDVDVVLDTVGGEAMDRLWDVLKPGGILVVVAGMPDTEKAQQHGVRTAGVGPAAEVGPILRQIAELIESGEVDVQVGRVFPLEEAAAAHALSETGHGRGRIVLHISD